MTTAYRLVGLEFDEGEHSRFLLPGVGALDVAATTQKTNVLGIFVRPWGSPARLGYIGGTFVPMLSSWAGPVGVSILASKNGRKSEAPNSTIDG